MFLGLPHFYGRNLPANSQSKQLRQLNTHRSGYECPCKSVIGDHLFLVAFNTTPKWNPSNQNFLTYGAKSEVMALGIGITCHNELSRGSSPKHKSTTWTGSMKNKRFSHVFCRGKLSKVLHFLGHRISPTAYLALVPYFFPLSHNYFL